MTNSSESYYLGIDVGGTKTHALIADSSGTALGFGECGPGNHESVGYDGLSRALEASLEEAEAAAGIPRDSIRGAGFGVAGYDWPNEKEPTLQAVATLGLKAAVEVVNDTALGILAGSSEGWGVAVVSGTGCNSHGWDRTRTREGGVTGAGIEMGEGAGASELVFKAQQSVAHQWTRRGPATLLTPLFCEHTGATSLDDLLEGLIAGRYHLDADAAPLVFRAAAAGDGVAGELIHWAGSELGELANAVIRQLEFEALAFDVVLTGSMYSGSAMLEQAMTHTIHALAPKARLVRLEHPPVVGAVLLGMEQAGLLPTPAVRQRLFESTRSIRNPN
jgi:N-acetylglucosamine kinase-like BadF-type ATPase